MPSSGSSPSRTHCFNSATAFEPWRRNRAMDDSTPSKIASIRPRLLSRGDEFDRRMAILTSDASIRPRLLSRGDSNATGVTPSRTVSASIRPRLLSRGDGSCRRFLPRGRTGFNSATAFEPWRRRSGGTATPSSVEGFNSATAFEPWRLPRAADPDAVIAALQFGHGF